MEASLTGLADLLIGWLLAVLGIGALALSTLRRRGIDPLLASFGALCLLYGVRQILDTESAALLGAPGPLAWWVTSFITYVIGVPAWSFFNRLLGADRRTLSWWYLRAAILFALIGITSDLLQQTPGTLTRTPNNLLVIAGLPVAVVSVIQRRKEISPDLRILIVGLALFGLFVLNDNLVSMGALPWSWEEESIGFLALVACLGYIAARRAFARERQLAALEGELATARGIQRSILPERLPEVDGLVLATRFLPSSAVAGDFFDFLPTASGGIGLLVADVSGHGVPAALIASMMKVAVTSCREHAARPAELMRRVNESLCGSFRKGFVTAAYVHLEVAAGGLVAASAGHPLPLLRRARDGAVVEVGGEGTILGRFRDARFEDRGLPIAAGDRLLLYTDGLIEARAPDGEIFGEERLRAALAATAELDAEAACDALLEEVGRWLGGRGGVDLGDDVTLVVADLPAGP